MTIAEAVARELKGHAGVAAITEAVYRLHAPGRMIRGGPFVLLSFTQTFDPLLSGAHVAEQDECIVRAIASDLEVAENLADEVNDALDNFTGLMGGAGGVEVEHMTRAYRAEESIEFSTEQILAAVTQRYRLMISQ